MNLIAKSGILILTISLVSILSSCASNQRRERERSAVTEKFVTNITDNGVKQFSYTVERARSGGGHWRGREGMGRGDREGGGGMWRGDRERGGMGGGYRSDSATREKRMEDMMIQRLDAALKKNKYCHDGYTIIDKSMERGAARITGECKDRATAEDRKNFINSAPASAG